MGITEKLYEIFRQNPVITTDSRKITPGAIFFALKGDNFNGNRFASKAIEEGAVLAVIEDQQVYKADGKHLLVENVLESLQDLARYHRQAVSPKILAVTGSNGKTTTKELTAAVLSHKFHHLCFTQGNLNNHIGVPLTILSMPFDCDKAIIEMGASSQGEIRRLCSIALPDYGIITNIGNAHLDGFGGSEGVKKGKGELYEYLAAHNGTGFLREEDTTLKEVADSNNLKNRITYSGKAGNDYHSHLVGNYNTLNIAAAVSIGRYFGIEEEAIKEAIESYVPSNNRSQRRETEYNTLIVDCYNANPSSMKASIDNFISLQDTRRNGKIMILGDMLELGEWSYQSHKDVIESARNSLCNKIYLVGSLFGHATAGVHDDRIHTFPDCMALCESLEKDPIKDATILIKGSHSIGLEKCLEIL